MSVSTVNGQSVVTLNGKEIYRGPTTGQVSSRSSNVYGVEVRKTEGRCGMVALTLLPGEKIDWKAFSKYVEDNLPVYARPYFVRIRKEADATSSFKQLKTDLQKEGFDPSKIKDKMYFLNPGTWKYMPLTKKVYDDVQSGKYRF